MVGRVHLLEHVALLARERLKGDLQRARTMQPHERCTPHRMHTGLEPRVTCGSAGDQQRREEAVALRGPLGVLLDVPHELRREGAHLRERVRLHVREDMHGSARCTCVYVHGLHVRACHTHTCTYEKTFLKSCER